MQETFTIKLPIFEGPFDLLLFFIERDELDIYDIPISSITDHFLSYLRQMELMNIDLASEFIVVAATLCRIKAKLLLPRKQVDEVGNEIDPREELVQKLLEYQRYKAILDDMRLLEENRSKKTERGNISSEMKQIAEKALVDSELESVTLFKLFKTFERLISKYENKNAKKTVHQIVRYTYTIQAQQHYLLQLVETKKQASFEQIFTQLENRVHAIVTFLALLELLNLQRIAMIQREGINNFWLCKQMER
ncbi:MAG: segregation/condensation protein A [Saprospiraceae bacterium]|nr:segregation/condensation protein A [Saprospiraceae bacterium]